MKVAVTDVDGILRGKYLDKQKFLAATESGFGFCNVVFGWDSSDECYDNTAYTGWQSGYPDAEVRVDLSTHRAIPWEDDRDFFLGDFVNHESKPLEVCPRSALRGVIERATSMGYDAQFGLEFEWFNFAETPQSLHDKDFRGMTPLTPGMFGYSIVRQTHNQPFFDALLHDLRAFGVPLEGLHCETGPGVFEAAILYTSALEAADRAQLFKSSVKEIAHRFEILPTFMARWNLDLPGCSGHAHQSLWDVDARAQRVLRRDRAGSHERALPFVRRRRARAPARAPGVPRADGQQLQAARSTGSGHPRSRRGASTTARSRAVSSPDRPSRRASNCGCPARTSTRISRWPRPWVQVCGASSEA